MIRKLNIVKSIYLTQMHKLLSSTQETSDEFSNPSCKPYHKSMQEEHLHLIALLKSFVLLGEAKQVVFVNNTNLKNIFLLLARPSSD